MADVVVQSVAGEEDLTGNASDYVWAPFTTTLPNSLIVAVFAGNGGTPVAISSFTSPNLTWIAKLRVSSAANNTQFYLAFAATPLVGEIITQLDSGGSYNNRDFILYILNGSDADGYGNVFSEDAGDVNPQALTISSNAAGSLLIGAINYRAAGADIAVDANTTSDYNPGRGHDYGFNARTAHRLAPATGDVVFGWEGNEFFGEYTLAGIEIKASSGPAPPEPIVYNDGSATLGQVIILFDSQVQDDELESPIVALPVRCSQIEWQISYDVTPAVAEVFLQGSIDGIRWTTIDTSTAVAGEIRQVNTAARFLRGLLGVTTAGTEITAKAVAKFIKLGGIS